MAQLVPENRRVSSELLLFTIAVLIKILILLLSLSLLLLLLLLLLLFSVIIIYFIFQFTLFCFFLSGTWRLSCCFVLFGCGLDDTCAVAAA